MTRFVGNYARGLISQEKSYQRYVEDDFEWFPEYQKAIPFLTISDEERAKVAVIKKQQEIDELEVKTATIDEQETRIKQLEETQENQAKILRLIEKYPKIVD